MLTEDSLTHLLLPPSRRTAVEAEEEEEEEEEEEAVDFPYLEAEVKPAALGGWGRKEEGGGGNERG